MHLISKSIVDYHTNPSIGFWLPVLPKIAAYMYLQHWRPMLKINRFVQHELNTVLYKVFGAKLFRYSIMYNGFGFAQLHYPSKSNLDCEHGINCTEIY